MLPIFCLRLAGGMIAALLLLSPVQVNPRFYRTHFLTALGLTTVAALFVRDTADAWQWLTLGAGLLLSFGGSLSWSLEGAPGGRTLIGLTAVVVLAALGLVSRANSPDVCPGWLLTNELTSAALLGAATTAMLMGHSYLIAPATSLTPLRRLLAALAGTTLLRLTVAGAALWSFTGEHALTTLNDVTIWLPVRWGLGFVGPLALAVLAWQTAKIRSTQSATGILYVVVILCFLGELTSQLLVGTTGFML
jgi:hypothetical protein